MGKGWIAVHRKIFEHWLWQAKPFSKGQAWIDLLLLANHKDTETVLKDKIVICKRGTVCRSILSLSERWGWDRHTVSRFLKMLVREKMVSVEASTHRTVITIVNYDIYQNAPISEPTETADFMGKNEQWSTTDAPTTRQPSYQQVPINNNDKQSNNVNKRFVKPTVDEVKAYCEERKNGIDPVRFVNFYESKDWMIGKNKMKDWKAAVRTWEQTNKKQQKQMQDRNAFNRFEQNQYDFDQLEKDFGII